MPHVIAALLLLTAVSSQVGAQAQAINSFETPADVGEISLNKVTATATTEHVTDGKQALKIEFPTGDWPGIRFNARQPWDWQAYGGLAIDITNPGTQAVKFSMRMDDDPSADGRVHCRTGNSTVQPGQSGTFVFPFAQKDPMAYGMRGLPPAFVGMTSLSSSGAKDFNPGHITAVLVFLDRPTAARTLIIDNVRVVAAAGGNMEKFVDEFGQFARRDWPGKLKNESEFKTRLAEEMAELAANPTLADRDEYGGWSKGPALKATGFFRTEKVNGKWWLVTPTGRLFFSMGADCVGTDNASIITGRQNMFSWLPEKNGPLGKHYGYVGRVHSGPVTEGQTYNFLTANLQRKYGDNYNQAFLDMALKRLPAWGFNTIANWSDQKLYRNGRMPYTATSGINGNHARVSSGSDYWGKMHDPYDPQFAADVLRSATAATARVKGDPWCIGYFVDNELSWGGFGNDGGRYGLAYGALTGEATSPAKAAFIAQLKAKYSTVEQLNAAWGINLANWEELNQPYKAPTNLNAAAKADMGAYVKEFARQYFRVVNDALKRADPDHLYLGCRFAWSTPEAVAAGAEFCDVVSFNIYSPRIDDKRGAEMTALNKPCIIGEFHFGALDRGMLHTGLVSTPSQAAMYQDYLGSVIDNPALVGCHWFQYVDQPVTGRSYDGENYNIGFLTVTDTPYPEMVAAAKAIHGQAYVRRFGK